MKALVFSSLLSLLLLSSLCTVEVEGALVHSEEGRTTIHRLGIPPEAKGVHHPLLLLPPPSDLGIGILINDIINQYLIQLDPSPFEVEGKGVAVHRALST